MSMIKDLSSQSISEMSQDEAIEFLRQIRLSRRTPVRSRKAKSTIRKSKTAKTTKMTKTQAAELLKLLSK